MSNIITLGAGNLWVKATGTNPATVRVANLKKITIGMTKDSIDLQGAYEFPIDVAGGKASCKGKLTIAGLETSLFAPVFPSTVTSVGYDAMAVDEAATIPTTPFSVTVTHAGAIVDYGVLWTTDDVPMTRVASAPTTGQYSVDETTGVYTFAAADTGLAVKISYSYAVVGSGQSVDIKSGLIGASPSVVLQGWNTYGGKKVGYRFPTAKLLGPSFDLSTEQHTQMEIDWAAFALPGQTLCKLFFA